MPPALMPELQLSSIPCDLAPEQEFKAGENNQPVSHAVHGGNHMLS
jgi:hypothetical protein